MQLNILLSIIVNKFFDPFHVYYVRLFRYAWTKWQHYQPDIILLTVRWYLRYNLSFRNLVEMMEERGLSLVHTTIMRWVHQYGPELDKKLRCYLKKTTDSWRVDETYITVKGQWMYLYRAVDSKGNTIDFTFSQTRDPKVAK